MENQALTPNSVVFCQKRWPIAAAFLSFAIALTFIWAFLILSNYLDEYRFEDYSINAFDGGMAGMLNIAATGAPTTLPAIISPAVVTLVGGDLGQQPIASATIVHPEGYLLTTAHSLDGMNRITALVESPNGVKRYPVEMIKIHTMHDLAILKMVTNDRFLFLKLADTQALSLATPLTAVGRALDGQLVVRGGVLQQQGQTLQVGGAVLSHLMTTNLPFSRELSGGPMVTQTARLAGVNIVIQVVDAQGRASLTGYTVPAHVIRSHFQDVVTFPAEVVNAQQQMPTLAAATLPDAPATLPARPLAAAWWDRARQQISQEQGGELLSNQMAPAPPFPTTLPVASAAPSEIFRTDPVAHIGSAGDRVTLLDLEQGTGFNIGGYQLDAMFGLALLGVLGGMVSALMPMGGSIIIVSGMMLLFGYGLYLIRPAIYVTNLFTYGISARHLWQRGWVMRARIRPLLPWILFGVIIGYFIGHNLHDHIVGYLVGLFAILLAAIAIYDHYNPIHRKPVVELLKGSRHERLNKFLIDSGLFEGRRERATDSWINDAVMGGPLGLLMGVLSISSGLTEAQYQQRWVGLARENAVANSVVMVLVASAVAALISFGYGTSIGAFSWQTPLTLAMILIPSIYGGALLGERWRVLISVKMQRWLFAVVMMVIGFVMLFGQ